MDQYQNYAATILRVALGTVFLAHSAYLKVFVFTVGGTVAFFESLGLPPSSAYIVLLVEIIGGLLLILGWRIREAALTLFVVSIGATWAHLDAGWVFSNAGGGWEYPMFLAIACIVQSMLGPGALRLSWQSFRSKVVACESTPDTYW